MSQAKGNSSGKINAPLWTWLLAGTVALVFIAVSYYSFIQFTHFDQFNPKRLASFAFPRDEKVLNIAVIGTSLTYCALYKDADMERFAKGRGLNIRFLRFSLAGGSLNDFYELTEAVVHSGADMIFIEAAIFGLDMGNEKTKYDRFRYYLRHGGTKLLARLPFVTKRRPLAGLNENYIDIEPSGNPFFGQNHEKEAELYLDNISQFRIRDFSEGKKFAPLFNLARSRGQVVVFLDLSRSRNAWDMLPANFEGMLSKTMGCYEKVYGMYYLRFPYRLPLEYFRDFAHFGAKGRRFYSEWFLDNLASLPGGAGK